MPKSIVTLGATVVQSRELVGTKVQSQVALMSIQSGAYYGLDSVASRIWELVAQPRSVVALCEQLIKEYEVPRKQCEEQVLGFLQLLVDAGLLCLVVETNDRA